jgi:transposase
VDDFDAEDAERPEKWAGSTAIQGSAFKKTVWQAGPGVLNQAANPAVKVKGTIFAIAYRRFVPTLGRAQAIGAIAHRLCRLIWQILHQGMRYEERGPAVSEEAKKARARKMIRELRNLGYSVELLPAGSGRPA